jgi:5-(carboxyamino)imidazole ribonucleotide mutase
VSAEEATSGPLVGIIMGSDSDLPIMAAASEVLAGLGVPFEERILSVHRTPDAARDYVQSAVERGLRVIIAGAGGAAHLPGMTAAWTVLPVIGVPVRSRALSGVDSLYSIVQMPPGVPVATVAIDGGHNAGLLAAQIVGAWVPEVQARLIAMRAETAAQVAAKDIALQRDGSAAYLAARATGEGQG